MTGDGDTSLLRVRNASVALAGQPVLDSVDVSVAPGEIVTLIGPNGSGKTTLVRLALGLIVADSGTIHRARGLRIGYVPQVFSLDETLPLTTARLLALTGAGDRDRAREALEQVGASRLLEHRADAAILHQHVARQALGQGAIHPDIAVFEGVCRDEGRDR